MHLHHARTNLPRKRAADQGGSRTAPSRWRGFGARALLAFPLAALLGSAVSAADAPALDERIASLLQREGLLNPMVPTAAAVEAEAAASAASAGSAPRSAAVPGARQLAFPARQRAAGLIVRLRDGDNAGDAVNGSAPAPQALAALRSSLDADTHYQRAMSGGLHVLRFNSALGAHEAEARAQALLDSAEVEWAVPDLIVQPQITSIDPLYERQWNLHDPLRSGYLGIDAESAWPGSNGGASVVVAVIDNGIRPHPEFGSRILPGYDFVSDPARANDGNGRDADPRDPGDAVNADECGRGSPATTSSWHGTSVAGILAADGANGSGIAGVAWAAKILPVRVLGKCGGAASDIVDGMRWAVGLPVPGVPNNPHPARILNLSLSVEYPYGCYPPFRDAIAETAARGALVVVAAGNEASPITGHSPANCSQALAAIATAPDGSLASYSNYGRIGLSAPGGDADRFGSAGGVLTTTDSGTRAPRDPAYGYGDGTSLAAPHLAGIAALALSIVPRLSAAEMRSVLLHGSVPFAPNSQCARSGLCGAGHADAPRALAAAWALSNYMLVREFYNTDLRHYFRSGSLVEATAINSGGAGPGWAEITDHFYAWSRPTSATSPVCRFYGTPGIGPNSHFYTASAEECEAVKRDPGWTYEGTAFHVVRHSSGNCPAGTIPVYRAYNQRWQVNDSNHRYTADARAYRSMTSTGWTLEGVAWCAAA